MPYCRSNILLVSDRALSRMIPHLCLCFLQSCNKSLIDQACSGPYWDNIGPKSFLYGPRCAQSVLTRPRADIRPVRPSRLVNKIHVFDTSFQRPPLLSSRGHLFAVASVLFIFIIHSKYFPVSNWLKPHA